jgi:hypothetical protein
MRVARQAPSTATGCLVFELKAEGEKESDHQFYKGLAVANELKVGRFVPKIDGDGAVFSSRFSRCAHVSSLCPQVA